MSAKRTPEPTGQGKPTLLQQLDNGNWRWKAGLGESLQIGVATTLELAQSQADAALERIRSMAAARS